ncbi:MAG: thioesterase family protein [Planctomycetota bacterium]|nr:thioesterase family protein [Planctomycetota bacterium]
MPEAPAHLVRLDELPDHAPTMEHPRPWLVSIRTTGAGESRSVAHISNIEYVRWLDRAAELHLDHLGWTRQAMLEAGTMWFVARHEIDYRAEVHANEELVLATWVRDLKRSKSWRDTIIWRPGVSQDDEPVIVCTASTLWVHVDLDTRRPCRVGPEMAAAIDPLHPPRLRRDQGASPCT